ncbi:LCP family protein [Streptomyces ipomoeae]|uniref:LCP family glycopolymer transferase n=1 Tax=Streptomyces ipomoeae TaxID=103232 RepID=UPI0011468815|nr:LCP family protein [Streptomyces ipomoeae]TQE19749.1 glycosyltransferase [Streptomyces ipomoeae]
MKGRHALCHAPRGHWPLLVLAISVLLSALLFEGWSHNEVDASRARLDCTRPVPKSVDEGGPVLRISGDRVLSAGMPARTVALTFDGGPDPVWTPRLLDLLHEHRAHATFFLDGSRMARYPQLVRRILAERHEIGSRTYSGAALGPASRTRGRLELSLSQRALAGAAGVRTTLLRMPGTTAVDTLCGAEWKAALRAAADGYVVVAADPSSRSPARGAIRQFAHTDLGYGEAKGLLRGYDAAVFTTVTDGLGWAPANPRASAGERLEGVVLLRAADAGQMLADGMTWLLVAVGVLGVLRLLMLVLMARTHVRRIDRAATGHGGSRPREVADPVTVLVPAHNEEAGIGSTIRSLLASTHPHLQIMVIDDGSTDRTADIVEGIADPRVTVIRRCHSGKAAALNHGLAWAMHDIVVMIDADTVLEPDAVYRLIQPLADPAVGAVSGNAKVGNRHRLLARWQHLEYVFGFNLDRRMLDVLKCIPTVPGAISAFRREALIDVGGVSEDTLAEDTDLTMALWRAGWQAAYEESAIGWTEVPVSLRQLWRQRYRWCYGTLQAVCKHRRALVERGPAGRFGRRGLTYVTLFQVALPLFAPVIDVFAVYGALFENPVQAAAVWFGFLAMEVFCARYALRLDGEPTRDLWTMPFQLFVYRQLMYLVVIQSVVTLVVGGRLKWQRPHRAGTADQESRTAAPHAEAMGEATGRHRVFRHSAGLGTDSRRLAADAPAVDRTDGPSAGGAPVRTASRRLERNGLPGLADGLSASSEADRNAGRAAIPEPRFVPYLFEPWASEPTNRAPGSGGGPPAFGRTHPRRRSARVHRSRNRRIARTLLVLALPLLLVPVGAYLWADFTLNREVDLGEVGIRPPEGRGTNYLIVGSDSREGLTEAARRKLHTGSFAGSRTDSMILLHTGAHGTTMVSLPRDSWVTIPRTLRPETGKSLPASRDKLNAAYTLGGPELLVQTIEHNTGLRVDHYAEIGLGGFVRVVDALGGVEMCMDRDIKDKDSGLDVKRGCQVFDGAKALAFVRQRKQEAQGDLGRTMNQQKFLAALAERATRSDVAFTPSRLLPAADAGLDTLVVDEGTGLTELAAMFQALRNVTGGGGRQINVPASDVDFHTAKGIAVLWDTARANRLFRELRNDLPVTSQ